VYVLNRIVLNMRKREKIWITWSTVKQIFFLYMKNSWFIKKIATTSNRKPVMAHSRLKDWLHGNSWKLYHLIFFVSISCSRSFCFHVYEIYLFYSAIEINGTYCYDFSGLRTIYLQYKACYYFVYLFHWR